MSPLSSSLLVVSGERVPVPEISFSPSYRGGGSGSNSSSPRTTTITAMGPCSRSMSDADAAAGIYSRCNTTTNVVPPPPPLSLDKSDIDIDVDDDDMTKSSFQSNSQDTTIMPPVFLLGLDISSLSRKNQFMVCAAGLFTFSLLYGYLQELISVELCNRQLGLFLACIQFSGYSLWSFTLRNYAVVGKQQQQHRGDAGKNAAPVTVYLGLSLLRAIEIGMTNLAIQYINYPAKTLMKSTRVIFTMAFGLLIARKKYRLSDYLVVVLMVTGLAVFMHADANSSAVFHHWGILMLTISMLCDGAISNISEAIMSRYGVGQDDFIFNMYSIALVAVAYAATWTGDLWSGLQFLSEPGTFDEFHLPIEERSSLVWTPRAKIAVMVLFASTGFFGASCSAAITKNFGALTMSMTSTARKATTLFMSFLLFHNECTLEHVGGVVLFLSSLIFKAIKGKQRRNNNNSGCTNHSRRRHVSSQQSFGADSVNDLELAILANSMIIRRDDSTEV